MRASRRPDRAAARAVAIARVVLGAALGAGVQLATEKLGARWCPASLGSVPCAAWGPVAGALVALLTLARRDRRPASNARDDAGLAPTGTPRPALPRSAEDQAEIDAANQRGG